VSVRMQTSKGTIVLELDADKAPETVANFLEYVRSGFYDGTIFHRVIPGFMIQGGGFTTDLNAKPPMRPSLTKPTTASKICVAPSPWPAPWIPTPPPRSSSSM